MHADFAGYDNTGAGLIYYGVPFVGVDSDPLRGQKFPMGPTDFNLYPTESDVRAGARWSCACEGLLFNNRMQLTCSKLIGRAEPQLLLTTHLFPRARRHPVRQWALPLPRRRAHRGRLPGLLHYRLQHRQARAHRGQLHVCAVRGVALPGALGTNRCVRARLRAPLCPSKPGSAHLLHECRALYTRPRGQAAQPANHPPLPTAGPPAPADPWHCANGAAFNLSNPVLPQRPLGWTSGDAAGLPIYPGLVKVDEAKAGVINHAIRFTAPHVMRAYAFPATHLISGRECGCAGLPL